MRGLFARLTDRGRKLAACPGGAFGQKPAQRQVICRGRTLSPGAAVHQTIGRRASPLSHVGSSSYSGEVGGRASAQDGCPVRKGSKPPLQWRLVGGAKAGVKTTVRLTVNVTVSPILLRSHDKAALSLSSSPPRLLGCLALQPTWNHHALRS